jgi:tetratricopeptide (TPR) repeat protein
VKTARRRLVALLFLSLFCACVPVLAQSLPGNRERGSAAGDLYLVLPFESTARDPRLAWLGEGLAELFVEHLASQDRLVFARNAGLAAVEKIGLPPSTRFTRATMLKIAQHLDADSVLYGRFASDGRQITVTARLLRVSPPALSPEFSESGPLQDLLEVQARVVWHLLRTTDPLFPQNLAAYLQAVPRRRLDAFEHYIRGLLASDDARLRHLRDAARLDPDWSDPAFALGETYFAARNCEPALTWLSKVVPGHRRGVEAAFAAGVCHLLRNDASRAESAFASVLTLLARRNVGQSPAEVLNNLAIAQARQGKSAEAAANWQRAQHRDDDEAGYWFNAAVGAMRTAEAAHAVRHLRELLNRTPDDGQARALLLLALERAGRATEAAALREECASATCGASGALLAAAKVSASGSSAAAPADPWAQLERISPALDSGALLFPLRRNDESAGHEHYSIHLERGRHAVAEGRLDEARRDFSEAVILAPESVESRVALADVHQRQGRYDDAVRELRAALWGREDAAVRVRLAQLFIARGLTAEARTELRAALRAAPEHAEARRLLDGLGPGGGAR